MTCSRAAFLALVVLVAGDPSSARSPRGGEDEQVGAAKGAPVLARWSAQDGPEPREHPAVIDDGARRRVLVFAGSGYAPQLSPLDDLWAFDQEALTWTRLEVSGEVPPGGGSQRVAQAPGAEEAWLFGGYDGEMNAVQGLYHVELGDEGAHFTRVPLAEGSEVPPGRFLHGFARDEARGRCVLFGGIGDDDLLGDTWLLEIEDGAARWSRLEGDEAPSPRYGFAHALDPSTGRFVVAGGADERFPEACPEDTWALDPGEGTPRWRRLDEAVLSARRNPCQALTQETATLVVHGGTADGRGVSPGTWALDLGAEVPRWRELVLPEGAAPRASGAGFGALDGESVWLGFGNSAAGVYRDLFRVSPASPTDGR